MRTQSVAEKKKEKRDRASPSASFFRLFEATYAGLTRAMSATAAAMRRAGMMLSTWKEREGEGEREATERKQTESNRLVTLLSHLF